MTTGFIDEHGHPLLEVEVGGNRTTVTVSALVDSGFVVSFAFQSRSPFLLGSSL